MSDLETNHFRVSQRSRKLGHDGVYSFHIFLVLISQCVSTHANAYVTAVVDTHFYQMNKTLTLAGGGGGDDGGNNVIGPIPGKDGAATNAVSLGLLFSALVLTLLRL